MKKCPSLKWVGMLMTCLIPLLASAQNPSLNYQVYKDPAGNTLRAHIWKVVGGEVFLETDQGRKLRLPINIFSAAPNFPPKISSTAINASFSELQIYTPFPEARLSALITIG